MRKRNSRRSRGRTAAPARKLVRAPRRRSARQKSAAARGVATRSPHRAKAARGRHVTAPATAGAIAKSIGLTKRDLDSGKELIDQLGL
jgi:hypothetical protein